MSTTHEQYQHCPPLGGLWARPSASILRSYLFLGAVVLVWDLTPILPQQAPIRLGLGIVALAVGAIWLAWLRAWADYAL